MDDSSIASSSPRAFAEVVQVLRDVAGHEQGIDPHRAAISASVAALVAACGRHVEHLPPDVAHHARAVVGAVDRAAGLHR